MVWRRRPKRTETGVGQSNIIDLIVRGHSDGLTLVMIEQRDWASSSERLRALQTKIDLYLDYIESGQADLDHPELSEGTKTIQLHVYPALDDPGRHFTGREAERLASHGIVFSVVEEENR